MLLCGQSWCCQSRGRYGPGPGPPLGSGPTEKCIDQTRPDQMTQTESYRPDQTRPDMNLECIDSTDQESDDSIQILISITKLARFVF